MNKINIFFILFSIIVIFIVIYLILLNQLVVLYDFKYETRLKKNYNKKIDVVYTWVNDKDTKWLSKKNKYKKHIPKDTNKYHNSFENNNEIIYSVFSVKKYMPWVNHIYIVTDNQVPLLKDFDNITIIDHKEIIDNKYLPVFNSHAIESNIHHIPQLSEYFIYMNDDLFINKPLFMSDFLNDDGRIKIQINNFCNKCLKKNDFGCLFQDSNLFGTYTWKTEDETHKNLNEFYKKNNRATLRHTPLIAKRSILFELEKKFKKNHEDTSKSKFRKTSDIKWFLLFIYHEYYNNNAVVGSLRSLSLMEPYVPFLYSYFYLRAKKNNYEVFSLNQGNHEKFLKNKYGLN